MLSECSVTILINRPSAARLVRAETSDTPDSVLGKPPGMRPDWSRHPTGMDALGGDAPFIMEPDGRCLLFVPSGLKDGPLPTHYEPVESPVANPLYQQQVNPAAKLWPRPGNVLHAPQDPRYPYIFTTYRLTELHCGIATRVMAHTAELQPRRSSRSPRSSPRKPISPTLTGRC